MKERISVIDTVRYFLGIPIYSKETYRLKRKLDARDYPAVVYKGWEVIERIYEKSGRYDTFWSRKVSEILDKALNNEISEKKR